MKKKVSLSFIVPYYQVEMQLLDRCLKSIIALNDDMDWEAWIIDDGSEDNSVEEYLGQQNNSHLHYYHQTNQGLGAARNKGMSLAQKEYIHFLDADDYLIETPARKGLDVLNSARPDLLAFDLKKVYSKEYADLPKGLSCKMIYQGNGTDYMLHHNLHGSACGYFFRKSILGNLKFSNSLYHEDEEFTPLLFLQAKRLTVCNLPIYAYYQREGSIVHHSSPQQIEKRFTDFILILNHLSQIAANQSTPLAREALTRRIDMLRMDLIYKLISSSPNTRLLLHIINQMKKEGHYPLPSRRYTALYTWFRRFTGNLLLIRFWKTCFRWVHSFLS